MLNEGAVSFTFKKTDGSTRKARGTTSVNLMPESQRATVSRNTPDSEKVDFWDLDKNAWRSFNRANLDQSSVTSEGATEASA